MLMDGFFHAQSHICYLMELCNSITGSTAKCLQGLHVPQLQAAEPMNMVMYLKQASSVQTGC